MFVYENNLLIHNLAECNNMKHSLAVLDLDGIIKEKHLIIPERNPDFNYIVRNNFMKKDSKVRFFTSFNYTVFSYSKKGFKPLYYFDFLSNNSPENYISTLNSQQDFRNYITNSNYVHSIITFLELGDWVYIKFVLKQKTYSVYYNTNTREIRKYIHNNLHDLFVQITPQNVQQKEFINVFYPHYKLSGGINYEFRLKYSKGKIDSSLISEFKKLLAMKVNENPVIIFTKPKH
nr:6-bladed beta-propeller [Maribellus maritimus]